MKKAKLIVNKAVFSLIIISLLSLVYVPALAAPATPTYYLTDVNCKPGEEIVVFLRIFDAKGLQSSDAQIKYDSKYLEFLGFEQAQEAKDADIVIEGGNIGGNTISMAFFHMYEVSEEHNNLNIAKITFKAKKEGKSKLTLIIDSLELENSKGDIASEFDNVYSEVNIGKNIESKYLKDIKESDIDWSGIDFSKPPQEDSSKITILPRTFLLVGSIIFIAAIGIVVVVSVLRRKSTDVNPNKIDVKKQ